MFSSLYAMLPLSDGASVAWALPFLWFSSARYGLVESC